MVKEKEREERERAERDAKWRKDQEERERLSKEWMETHKNLYKHTYMSYYNRETFDYGNGPFCDIHFYEWSNIDSWPLKFDKYGWFYKFLDESDLWIDVDTNLKMRSYSHVFITCKPGSKDLIVCNSYEELKREFHLAENTAKVLAVVPEI
jgi:hypothetical protein